MNLNYFFRPWMKHLLVAAAIYNLAWGAFAVLAPSVMLSLLAVQAGVAATAFWRCIGMIVGVYGIGYWIASSNPYRHWPIVLVGLLGKICGPIGFVIAVAAGDLPASMGWTILLNDLIWWVPFLLILWGAIRHSHVAGSAHEEPESDDPLGDLRTNSGKRLDELADAAPQMVVFLRHAGCTFCRQALADISACRQQIEAAGCEIVFVHLGTETEDSIEVFERYGVENLPRISDPTSRLYRQFGLDIGGFSELFGLRVWMRGLVFGVVNGHGVGAIKGNSFQMPGVYLYHCGTILAGFRHEAASDRPDYIDLLNYIDTEGSLEDNGHAVRNEVKVS